MKQGPLRMGMFLTVIWIASVAGYAAWEYSSRNVFCEFASPGAAKPICQHFFWSCPQESFGMFTDLVPRDGSSFTANVGRMLTLAVGVPIVAWLLSFGIAWVARGFQAPASSVGQSIPSTERPAPTIDQHGFKFLSPVVLSSLALSVVLIESGSFPYRVGLALGQILASCIIAAPIVVAIWTVARKRNAERWHWVRWLNRLAVATALVWFAVWVVSRSALEKFLAG